MCERRTRRHDLDERPRRDIEKDYPLPQFIEKLRRLADALEKGDRFEIQIAGGTDIGTRSSDLQHRT
jgi:hypothetical protein